MRCEAFTRLRKSFSSIAAPITECLKGERFRWSEKAQKSFEPLKKKLTKAPVLAPPNADLVFEVHCNASNFGIGAVLNQEGRPFVPVNENLNDVELKYSTYDEFYATVRALKQWRHHLLAKEFVLYSDH